LGVPGAGNRRGSADNKGGNEHTPITSTLNATSGPKVWRGK